jgi:hypothetical protein
MMGSSRRHCYRWPPQDDSAFESSGRTRTKYGCPVDATFRLSEAKNSYKTAETERAGFEPAMEFNPHTRLAPLACRRLLRFGAFARKSSTSAVSDRASVALCCGLPLP